MKYASIAMVLGFALSSAAWARVKPANLPQCQSIASSCKAAGYMPGMHKKNGKGLWLDCIAAIAHGKTIAGVTGTQDDAKACMQAMRQNRGH